jgi:PEP-CTERM motif
MRRVVVLALLALALPMAAWASGIDLVNSKGSISISTAGITSHGSQLVQFNGIVPPAGKTLGSVSFSTGALTSGSIMTGATFSSTGSSFVVTGKGNFGQPKGVIFNGAFTGDITWTLVSQNGQTLTFQLSGNIQGVDFNGKLVHGTTTQTFVTTPAQLAKGIGHLTTGNTHIVVPEPGTLGLLGTGLIGVAGMFRRKILGRG